MICQTCMRQGKDCNRHASIRAACTQRTTCNIRTTMQHACNVHTACNMHAQCHANAPARCQTATLQHAHIIQHTTCTRTMHATCRLYAGMQYECNMQPCVQDAMQQLTGQWWLQWLQERRARYGRHHFPTY